MLCTRRLPGFPLSTFVITLILALLAACGGGDGTAPTSIPTSVSATPIPPATDPPVPATAVPAATSQPAATGSPMSGAATTESPVASPTVPPTAAATAGPTVAPTEVLASNAVPVLQRSCPEDFRQMLVLYDGAEEFGPEVVRRLSDEFVEVRPDCLAEGWDPVFSDAEPEVCSDSGTLSDGLEYKKNRRSLLSYVRPTMRTEPDRVDGRFILQVHFTKLPLLSMVPPRLLPLRPGEVAGGCWSYIGPQGGPGMWRESVLIYLEEGLRPGSELASRYRKGYSLNKHLPYTFPECDRLLQTVISTRLEAGLDLDASGVGDAIDESRVLAEGVCDANRPLGWRAAPVDVEVVGDVPVRLPRGSARTGVTWLTGMSTMLTDTVVRPAGSGLPGASGGVI